ncbi:hypothetical protein LCGC14_1494040 [marine sediment metagenome]|uniref:Uncharacterized protein n=1 Tax=marine sediment metagenome TaxID=412755 RepID=A0A0F9JRT8_9ZZZZ
MSKYITVNCPKCGAPATFDYGGAAEADALMLIGLDNRCCRRCGTLFVETEPDEEEVDNPDEEE